MKFNYLIFIIKACAFVTLNAQQKVTVDGKTFKSNMEVAESQISNQKISLMLKNLAGYAFANFLFALVNKNKNIITPTTKFCNPFGFLD